MSQPAVVLEAMRPGMYYDASDISAVTRFTEQDVAKVLRMLEKGGLVACEDDRYRKYTKQQRELFKRGEV